MRPWMEKWGSVMLILLCALVILFSALYTRQDDLRRIAAQNAAADQNERLADLPAYQPPVTGETIKAFTGAYKTVQGLWQMDPYVYYEVRKGMCVQAVCSGTVIAADEKQITLETRDQLIFCLRGIFSLLVRAGDTVAAGQEIAVCTEAGELRLSLSRDGHYLDPLSVFSEACMCGIMGYIGQKNAQEILLSGLETLSYRGYDSAGIAVQQEGKLHIVKTRGRIDDLRGKCDASPLPGTLGIGHTRWATHGKASDQNAHPHTDMRGRIAVVHNGVIENHAQLRRMLAERGYVFKSETDTECAAHLLHLLYDGDMLRALLLAARYLSGSYALAVICADDPSALYCIRSGSPLVLGMREGESYLSSDIPALLPYTRDLIVPEDGEAAVLRRSGICLFAANGQRRRARTLHVAWDVQSAERGAYPHFMLKEIHEQPQVLRSPPIMQHLPARAPSQAVLLGCGTAYHACLLGAYYMERLAGIPAFPEIASEYRSRIAFPYRDCACIAVSQSGETADTISAAQTATERGAALVTLTNTLGSRLERMASSALITPAGPELSVASTKAYTAQALALLHLALHWGQKRGALREDISALHLQRLPEWAREALMLKDAIQTYIEPRAEKSLFFFIGRGADAVTAREAALKFKEITYTPAESYPAGELKHGAIALIHEGMPVIAICTQPEWLHKTLVNLSECRARGAECVCFCLPRMEKEAREAADHVFVLPDMPPLLAPIVSVIPLQLLAYYAACKKGLDVDKPRNLAKSVTVE